LQTRYLTNRLWDFHQIINCGAVQSCPWAQLLQPNPSKSKNFGPTNQPNPTTYNQQQAFWHKEDNFNISQSVKVYQVLHIYQCLSLSGIISSRKSLAKF